MSRAKATALVKQLGADLQQAPVGPVGKGRDLDVYAPDGFRWKATGHHCIVVCDYTDAKAAWAALLEDMSEGLEKCEGECDVCERELPICQQCYRPYTPIGEVDDGYCCDECLEKHDRQLMGDPDVDPGP